MKKLIWVVYLTVVFFSAFKLAFGAQVPYTFATVDKVSVATIAGASHSRSRFSRFNATSILSPFVPSQIAG